jgi:hypothetical protein
LIGNLLNENLIEVRENGKETKELQEGRRIKTTIDLDTGKVETNRWDKYYKSSRLMTSLIMTNVDPDDYHYKRVGNYPP